MIHRIQGIVIAAAAIVLLLGSAPTAKAQCCNQVIIDNLASCTFNVCIVVGGVQVECRTLTQGSNIFWMPSCPAPTQVEVVVTDLCGNPVNFPVLGNCSDILLSATCCIHVCAPATGCFYQVTDGMCAAGC